MQPILYKTSTYVSVVYLLDVSQSVAPGAIQKAIDWIQKTNASGRPDHVGVCRVRLELHGVRQGRGSQEGQGMRTMRGPGILDQSKSDLSAALDAAMRSFAPNHLKRVVLLSDGNENSGDMCRRFFTDLQRENAHVYTVPLEARVNRDAWIESVLAPPSVTTDEQFPVEVHVYSQFDTTSTVELEERQ